MVTCKTTIEVICQTAEEYLEYKQSFVNAVNTHELTKVLEDDQNYKLIYENNSTLST